jgi:hypothetical protein
MGRGYTWYLFRAPEGVRSVTVEATYVPNGTPEPMPLSRRHEVTIAPAEED